MSHESVNIARLIHYGFMNWEKNRKKRNPLEMNKRTQTKRGKIPRRVSAGHEGL